MKEAAVFSGRFKYWEAKKSLPKIISPGVPAGLRLGLTVRYSACYSAVGLGFPRTDPVRYFLQCFSVDEEDAPSR